MWDDGKGPEKVKRKMGRLGGRRRCRVSGKRSPERRHASGIEAWCRAGQRTKRHHLQPVDLEVGPQSCAHDPFLHRRQSQVVSDAGRAAEG